MSLRGCYHTSQLLSAEAFHLLGPFAGWSLGALVSDVRNSAHRQHPMWKIIERKYCGSNFNKIPPLHPNGLPTCIFDVPGLHWSHFTPWTFPLHCKHRPVESQFGTKLPATEHPQLVHLQGHEKVRFVKMEFTINNLLWIRKYVCISVPLSLSYKNLTRKPAICNSDLHRYAKTNKQRLFTLSCDESLPVSIADIQCFGHTCRMDAERLPKLVTTNKE